MGLRRLGGFISASYNALASNVTSAGQVIRTSGVFLSNTVAQVIQSQQWSTDEFYNNNALYMDASNAPDNGTNTSFIDSSSNNFTVTATGSPGQGSSSPFAQPAGYWAFRGGIPGSGSYISFTNAALNIGSSADFTIEFWGKRTSIGSFNCAVNCGLPTNNVVLRVDSAWTSSILSVPAATYSPAVGAAAGKWFHYAISRSAGVAYVHIDGVQYISAANTYNLNMSGMLVGTYGGGPSQEWQGFLSNLRIVSGSAVYTNGVNFTPPTSPLTAISGTVLLTLQNNYFKDNSTNNIASVAFVTPKAVPVSPFPIPPYNYSPATIGGSVLFNGTSEYITVPDNAAFAFGAGNFTIEAWFNLSAMRAAATAIILAQFTVGGGRAFSINVGGNILSFIVNTSVTLSTPAASIYTFQWYHVAIVRNGANWAIYLNGTSVASTTATTIIDSTANVISGFSLDGAPATYYFPGLISNLRVVKGTAVYTANFTPPTEPLTRITNTSLLYNFTNGAIVDKAGKGSFSSTGNTSIDINNIKYGSGSIYFDGTTDCLIGAQSPLYSAGQQNLTYESWIFISRTPANNGFLIDTRTTTTSTFGFTVYITTARFIVVFVANAVILTTNVPIPIGAWTHIAVVKVGSLYTVYINGIKPPTGSASNAAILYDDFLTIGSSFNQRTAVTATDHFLGYMSDIRFTVNTARYTANFAPPVGSFPRLSPS